MSRGISLPCRSSLMIGGITLIGIGVALFRLAGLGVDPFTGMNLGLSMLLKWSFGNSQLLANAVILVVVFFTVRSCIGPGTIVNMVCVGYIADLICWLLMQVMQVHVGLLAQVVLLIAALLVLSFGVALYMEGDLGIAPYDSVAVVIETLTHHKIPFQFARILSDITVVMVGVLFCIAAGGSIWQVLGIGTVCNALLNGPAIQMFRNQLKSIFECKNKKSTRDHP